MTHHVRKHTHRFSVELAQQVMPAYRGAAYPLYNPPRISGASVVADLPMGGQLPEEVAERLAACVDDKSYMNKEPFAVYSEQELRAVWRRRRMMKEWLDRVSGLIEQQMQIIEGYHKGQVQTGEATLALEDMRRQTRKSPQDRTLSQHPIQWR